MFAQVIVDIAHQEVDKIFTYSVPEGMVVQPGMRVFVPFGRMAHIEGIVMALSASTEVHNVRDIGNVLDKIPVLSQEQLELAGWMAKQYHAHMAQTLRLLIPAGLRGGKVKTKTVGMVSPKEGASDLLCMFKTGTKAYELLEYLLENGKESRNELSKAFGDISAPLKKLVASGAVEVSQQEQLRSPYLDITPEKTAWFDLKHDQQRVLDKIVSGGAEKYLLHGVTGSGKTEVYMRAVREVAAQGKTAIVLVPEISLTPQMVKHFRERLGENIAILHSGLGIGERFDEWKRILRGEARIVIGARSAIFAPCENIGLIVVDEEHETSYCSDVHPRYDAIEVAQKRAEYNGCPLVLGSATPSISRYYQALNGKYTILELPERINGKGMPAVDVINMADEFAGGNRSIFSRRLYELMQQTLEKNNQIMLFLNRRGYASFVMCRACGEAITCKNCDVSMTYHNGIDKLVCHYCGFEMELPQTCPTCGSKYIKQFGAGTQKVEEEFKKLFPQVGVVRMDNDTTQTKDAHYHLLKKLADGEAQVLIGTQMIAKGHDFPRVALVGVIAADNMLKLPDYRSRERTFSLITQVSGRAGRAAEEGRVVVQTYTPKHFVIECASRHDYKAFYEQEIEERRAMRYPPFAKFIRVLFASSEAENAYDASIEAYDAVRALLARYKDSVLYFERTAAPIARIKEMYRYQLLIKLIENDCCTKITEEVFNVLERLELNNTYRNIEVNPVSLF